MAETANPKFDKHKNKDMLDKTKLREQLSTWHRQVVISFRNEGERQREELLNELEENMPARLSEVTECLQMFLEHWSDFGDTYNLFLKAHDMTLGIKTSSTVDGIDPDHSQRLKNLLEHLETFYLLECRWSVNIIQFLRLWSADLEKWKSDDGSVADLEGILKSFEDKERTAYVWPDILDNITKIHQKCEEERWPAMLLDIFHFMVTDVQRFSTSLGEAGIAPNMVEFNPLVERLGKMRSSLKDILERETSIPDEVVVNVDLDQQADEELPLQSTEQRETDIYCLSKRPIGRAKDLLIKNRISTIILHQITGTGENRIKEVHEKVDIIISHDSSKSYKSYHVQVNEGFGWFRDSAILQKERLRITGKLPREMRLFFTSMKNEMKTTLVPDKEYIHICPENNDVVVEFSKETVKSSQEIQITLRGIEFPLSEIAGYSDIVCIQHDEEFLRPVTVSMTMTMIEDNDIEQCDLYCVHIGDDGPTISKDVKVEVLSGNLCRFETTRFGRNVLNAIKKKQIMPGKNIDLEIFTKQLQMLHGPGPHRIIIFICNRYDDNTWQLLAEIVAQEQVENTIEKRRKEKQALELSHCRSRSLDVDRIKQIVILGDNCSLSRWKDGPTDRVAIDIIRGGEDNFIQFVVTISSGKKTGTVVFNAAGEKEPLHWACIDQEVIDRFNRFITSQRDPSSEAHSSTSVAETSGTSISPVAYGQSDKQLQLGEFFGLESMDCLINQITTEEMSRLATHLRLSRVAKEDIKEKYGNTSDMRLNVINRWLEGQSSSAQERVATLCKALNEADLQRIAGIVDSVFKKIGLY